MVEIEGDLNRQSWIWNGKSYIGEYNTKMIKAKLVKLEDIRVAYDTAQMGKTFNPRGLTGLRYLEDQKEVSTLLNLMR